MDITPAVPAGRMRVERYGGGGFTINGDRHDGSVIVLPTRVAPWPVAAVPALTAADFAAVTDEAPAIEVLLVGTGAVHQRLPASVQDHLRAAGIGCDVMATGSACRTYNVLISEDRRVAAALIAVD